MYKRQTEGKILLNGVDIRSIEYEDYIALFNVVFQDYKLLAFPLGQNVAASLEYDEKKVISSLEKAGFAERLSKMDKYLETPLYKDFDEDGVCLLYTSPLSETKEYRRLFPQYRATMSPDRLFVQQALLQFSINMSSD